MIKKNKIFIITGPSGVGKDTVLHELEKFNLPIRRIITTTSRPMRPEESEGNPYYFVSDEQFEEMIKQDLFIEYAKVFDNWKGITKSELERIDDNVPGVLLRIDYQGANTIRQKYEQSIVIVLTPPTTETLTKHMQARGDGNTKDLKTRIKQNKHWRNDYANFDYFVKNPEGHPEKAAGEIYNIILKYLNIE